MPDAAIAERTIAAIAGDAEILSAIHGDGIALAIWQRKPLSSIARMPLGDLRNLRLTGLVPTLDDALSEAMDAAGFRKGIARDALLIDIIELAARYAHVMRTGAVEIRLEMVTTNACKKFLSDYVTAGLITTYVGQGTQWLDHKAAAECDCGEPHDIQQLSPGDVAFFKGRLWSSEAPAIHRSPPIEGTGEARLVLVINPGKSNDLEPLCQHEQFPGPALGEEEARAF